MDRERTADFLKQKADLIEAVRPYQRAGLVAEFSYQEDQEDPSRAVRVHLRAVGAADWVPRLKRAFPNFDFDTKPSSSQAYYFLADELRPGSGIIRVSGGRGDGPEGTLTCLLSSKDGRANYFVAAGHVLSNFWNPKDLPGKHGKYPKSPAASIYRHRKGFPASSSRFFLGKICYLSRAPTAIDSPLASRRGPIDRDIGIVEIIADLDDVTLKQRTTCYGSFGEWPSVPDEQVYKGQRVMKCGAEETHWTYAVVDDPCQFVNVYGPNGRVYEIARQVILTTDPKSLSEPSSDDTAPPPNWSAKENRGYKTPFAVPGDSGTMVVDEKSKRPLGMLIAGSVLDGRYVMTPIARLWDFWSRKNLVFLRA